jgi:hypothetical protein
MIEDIKRWRLELDILGSWLDCTEQLMPFEEQYGWEPTFRQALSYKIGEAARSVTLARMWMGEFLGALGGENPYAENDGNRESIEDIIPTVDKAPSEQLYQPESEDEFIKHIDKLREDLRDMNRAFHNGLKQLDGYPMLPTAFVYQHITEGRLWLGQALGSIRDNSIVDYVGN